MDMHFSINSRLEIQVLMKIIVYITEISLQNIVRFFFRKMVTEILKNSKYENRLNVYFFL